MTQLFRFILVAAILFPNVSFTPKGKIISADKTASWIQYTVKHPLHGATAVSNDFGCNIDYNPEKKQVDKVAVSAKVSAFDSKNSNRDSNAMEAVESIKYPSAIFISSSVTPSGGKLAVKGNLTFHGVTQEINFNAEQKTEGNKLTVNGSFSLSLDAYKVERPSLLGMKIDDEMFVEFKAVFNL
jgi:polyisoprenoid-binding protein YceI